MNTSTRHAGRIETLLLTTSNEYDFAIEIGNVFGWIERLAAENSHLKARQICVESFNGMKKSLMDETSKIKQLYKILG